MDLEARKKEILSRERFCEDCGDQMTGRRFRCLNCRLLVCAWCIGHVHTDSRKQARCNQS